MSMGSADGEDAACSGTNGFCVPKDLSDVFEDRTNQQEAGNTTIRESLITHHGY